MAGGAGATVDLKSLTSQPKRKSHTLLAALALLAAGILFLGTNLRALAASGANVEGSVTDKSTGQPVAGATVSIPDLKLSRDTSVGGEFRWSGLALGEPSLITTIIVEKQGFGEWRLEDVRLVAGDTLLLTVEVGPEPTVIQVPPPRSERPSEDQPLVASAFADPPAEDQRDAPLPETIDVRITDSPYCDLTADYTVETIDFKEYVKHVLPNEWIPTWPRESLRAGAMAAKMYAWSYIAVGGKWDDADVYDSTCDQVYNPAVEYQSTNNAVDHTWNWRLTWQDDGSLVRAFYRAHEYQCPMEDCMGQWDSYDDALDRYSWDEILFKYYEDSELSEVWVPPGGYSLRYEGNGYGDLDRVKIPLDDPHRPVDVGATDFTIEWWLKARPGENGTASCSSEADSWVSGNTMLDRDIFGPGDHGDYGISLMDGRLAFGVHNGTDGATACGTTDLADGAWHHVAVQRQLSTGLLQIYVDGQLDGETIGPAGDISYRDGRTVNPDYPREPFLVVGAEKHDLDNDLYPSFLGWIDELRLSTTLRYPGAFDPPDGRFSPDGDTAALYHFNEGYGNAIGDSSEATGGPSDGFRRYGGVVNGPEWTTDSPWYEPPPTPTPTPASTIYFPIIAR